MKIQLFASGALAFGGVILMGMGLYFAFLRPPLLPEDLRYRGASLAQIQTTMPGLGPWLARVFGVLGGYMFATGPLTVYVAATGFRTGKLGAIAVVSVSGLASIAGWRSPTSSSTLISSGCCLQFRCPGWPRCRSLYRDHGEKPHEDWHHRSASHGRWNRTCNAAFVIRLGLGGHNKPKEPPVKL